MSKFNAQDIIDNHGGKCKTRNGTDAIIYAVHVGDGEPPIHGAILYSSGWNVSQWELGGKDRGTDSDYDLIMPRTVVAEWRTSVSVGSPIPIVITRSDAATEFGIFKIKTTLYSDDTVESEVVT